MQINSGQITPGPQLFQALHSGPKTETRAEEQKQVAETQNETAVQASDRPEPTATGRDFPRGSLVNIQV